VRTRIEEGDIQIRVKIARRNQRIQIRRIWANTHLLLALTAGSDGRLAGHIHTLICRIFLGPFLIGGAPTHLSINRTPSRLEPAKQIITANSTMNIQLDVPSDTNTYRFCFQRCFQVRQLVFQLSTSKVRRTCAARQ
jgi:hypothetical protein